MQGSVKDLPQICPLVDRKVWYRDWQTSTTVKQSDLAYCGVAGPPLKLGLLAKFGGNPGAMMPTWPEWWEWELELSSHLFKRMVDRDFDEIALRRMLTIASGYRPDLVPNRWIIETRHRRRAWEVIVEPDAGAQVLVVVTAYPVEP